VRALIPPAMLKEHFGLYYLDSRVELPGALQASLGVPTFGPKVKPTITCIFQILRVIRQSNKADKGVWTCYVFVRMLSVVDCENRTEFCK
jgi:hypothetical protein